MYIYLYIYLCMIVAHLLMLVVSVSCLLAHVPALLLSHAISLSLTHTHTEHTYALYSKTSYCKEKESGAGHPPHWVPNKPRMPISTMISRLLCNMARNRQKRLVSIITPRSLLYTRAPRWVPC